MCNFLALFLKQNLTLLLFIKVNSIMSFKDMFSYSLVFDTIKWAVWLLLEPSRCKREWHDGQLTNKTLHGLSRWGMAVVTSQLSNHSWLMSLSLVHISWHRVILTVCHSNLAPVVSHLIFVIHYFRDPD